MNPEELKKRLQEISKDYLKDLFKSENSKLKIKKESTALNNLEKIFDSAIKISNQKGFQAMTLRDLSADTGLSLGALYSYFASKEELLKLLQERGRRISRQILKEKIEDFPTAREKLAQAIEAHIFLSSLMQPWFYFSYMEAKNLSPEEQKKAVLSEQAGEDLLKQILEQGIASGEFKPCQVDLLAGAIKALLQDLYLKPGKHAKKGRTEKNYSSFVLDLLNSYILNQ